MFKTAHSLFLHLALLLVALLALTPLLWLICACFKQQQDIFSCAFLPWGHLQALTLENFRFLLSREPFGQWLLNSVFLASTQTVLVVVNSALAGFALAKYRFAGRRPVMAVILATMLMPGVVLLPSNWLLMYNLGWLNSYAAILVPGAASSFGTFLFMQAMQSVPDELIAAGRVDGCSELRLWWEVALPIVRPMLAAFTLLTFVAAWNSYLWPSLVLQDRTKLTLPIGLATLVGSPGFSSNYGALMAATFLSVLPVIVLFVALQRDFISGLSSGAVKG